MLLLNRPSGRSRYHLVACSMGKQRFSLKYVGKEFDGPMMSLPVSVCECSH